ncbi:Heat shock protein. Metallo peptidase. MEROPS family M48B [Syntrophus gentianae]|uniref:Protease HtpX homolog n=1 Tax=Syntrophus gentianae TaxID=43775 RepID=A0A1H7VS76_9BACT|nr:zinc metalloprotease HtpX [Syntrophus gentianae]SEM11647.1 Heat shock protein. Metallo peptidase. MEROPS family M48B [Syntrophus gentianae]
MNTLKVILLLASLSGLLMLVGYFVARGTGVVIALVLSALMNFGSYWYSDTIVLRMYSAREVSRQEAPVLYNAVESLSARAKMPKPRIYMISNETPNAFATGRDENHAAVSVTSGILKILNKEELEGVLAHELAHIQHKDILIGSMAATVASAVVLLSRWAVFFGNDEGKGMIPAIAMAIIAPIAATVIQMAISRSREYEADAGSAQITGKPEALAGALRKLTLAARTTPLNANPSTAHMFIVNPLSGDFIRTLFSTHPPIEKRIERLQQMEAAQKD